MAAHIRCHNSDILPNSFPPLKPTAQDYNNFMSSEYQARNLMNNFSTAGVFASGRQAYEILDDEIPVLSKPVPTVAAIPRKTNVDRDPLLCVTPEKKTPFGGRLRTQQTQDIPTMDADLYLSPEPSPLITGRGSSFQDTSHTTTQDSTISSPRSSLTHTKEFLGSYRTVRFDQNIEVRQMSPQSSIIVTPSSTLSTDTKSSSNDSFIPKTNDLVPETGRYYSIEQDNSNTTISSVDSSHSYNNQHRFDAQLHEPLKYSLNYKSIGNNNIDKYDTNFNSDIQEQVRVDYPKSYLTTAERGSTTNAVSQGFKTYPSNRFQHHSNRNDYLKTSNVCSGSLSSNSFCSSSSGENTSGLDSLSSHSSVEPESMETIDIIASDLCPDLASRSKKGRKLKLSGDTIVESVLARPEFSSTLRVRKELAELQDSGVDLAKAVKQKLKTSGKTKEKINEKAFSYVNQEDFQFSQLPGVEVRQEDAILIAEETITAKAKPAAVTRNKPENNVNRVPDIMEFFHRKFERETASYTTQGIPQITNKPCTAALNRAFDVYQHIRSWENW